MPSMTRIGVDVGGTNTDAVLMDGDTVLGTCKIPTTREVRNGIVEAIRAVLQTSRTPATAVGCVVIGTTQFANAFVERRQLMKTGVIRIALPAARGIPPLIDWPPDLRAAVGDHCHQVRGGHQFDGRVNAPLDEMSLARAARELRGEGIRTVALTSLFSPIDSSIERRSAEIVRNEMGDVSMSLSHLIGRVGLLERENATIMNASLAGLSQRVVASFRAALKELHLEAPFYISQNDGTLMAADLVERYPVFTFASGATNSMRGAAYLSGLTDGLVVDIGGTTTDIGVLANGFARESAAVVSIGGVRTNFRMPDILALGLGGGSEVHRRNGRVTVGPQSVGYELTTKSLLFGGDTVTASDVAVAAGYADFGESGLAAALPAALVEDAVTHIHQRIGKGVDRMKTSARPIPMVLVGGGAILVGRDIEGVSEVVVPRHADVANAIGASIPLVSGEADSVLVYNNDASRESALEKARQEAICAAVRAGAEKASIEIADVEEVPLTYAPNDAYRVRVRAVGKLGFHDSPANAGRDVETGG